MKYEVCNHCKHCTGRSHELTGDGVKHMCVCALDGCSMSMWDECAKWEEMKCDELTPIDLECNMGKDINGVVHRELWKAYDIDEVDAYIAQLKAENERLKAKLETVNELVKTSKDMYDHAIESQKAIHDTEMMDTGMRDRRLKRALWIARAKRAIEKIAWFKLWNASISTMNPEDGARKEYDKWKKALGKFLKKAEEYK